MRIKTWEALERHLSTVLSKKHDDPNRAVIMYTVNLPEAAIEFAAKLRRAMKAPRIVVESRDEGKGWIEMTFLSEETAQLVAELWNNELEDRCEEDQVS